MLQIIGESYDIEGKSVTDLGAGTGLLSIGCSIFGADIVNSYEIDDNAINIFKENIQELEIDDIEIIKHDITSDDFIAEQTDIVIMNPPFGTKQNEKIFLKFLE